MAALSNDLFKNNAWYQQQAPTSQRRAATIANTVVCYIGGLTMRVGTAGRPLLSGASLAAVCTAFNGADANGGIYARALVPSVTLQLAGGTSKTLAVTSITEGATIAVLIQLGTDGGDAVTTTGLELANLIKGNARLRELLRAEAQGTGASICAVANATAVAHIEVLGVPEQKHDASGGAITLRPSDVFHIGKLGMNAVSGSEPTLTDGYVSLANDNEISKATDGLDFHAPLVAIQGGLYYVDLEKAA